MLVVCGAIDVTGIDPVCIVEYAIVFSVIILPFTYFPLLVIAGDKRASDTIDWRDVVAIERARIVVRARAAKRKR